MIYNICDIHTEFYLDVCPSCVDDTKSDRVLRLYRMSHGYVGVVTNSLDEEKFGSHVFNTAMDEDVLIQDAVERMRQANPENLVMFAGHLTEFKTFFGQVLSAEA